MLYYFSDLVVPAWVYPLCLALSILMIPLFALWIQADSKLYELRKHIARIQAKQAPNIRLVDQQAANGSGV